MRWSLPFLLLLLSGVAYAETPPPMAERCVQHYAARYRLPPELIAAFIDVESRWHANALSNKGAMGLMQLMPATARRFGAVQPFDIDQNIAAGTRYLTTLMWEFHGDLRLVAAAYYAGDRWVAQKQLNYRNPDVIAYVQAVRRQYIRRKSAAMEPQRRQHHETTLAHSDRRPLPDAGFCVRTDDERTHRNNHYQSCGGHPPAFATRVRVHDPHA